MNYRLEIALSEEEYLDFNVYQNWDSAHGKKSILSARILLIVFSAVLLLIGLWRGHFTLTSFLFQIPMLLVAVLVQLLINKRWLRRALRNQMRSMKKKGKFVYDSASVMEFYEDTFTERAEEKEAECAYTAIERITVMKNEILYLHNSAASAYLVPRSAFDSDEDFAQFTAFITEACVNATVCKID